MKNLNSNAPLQRRRFLSSAALAAGGLALSSRASAQNSAPAGDPVKIALIGAGTQGQTLLGVCMKALNVRVVAVCDIWEAYNLNQASRILAGFKQEPHLYIDYREMLAKEKELEAVVIATPDFCHAEQTISCLQAGFPVYCESLMSNTIEGAKKMVQATKETGKLLQIGFQRRSNPRYRFAYEHIVNETKMLGKISAANGQWNRPVQTDRGWPKRAPLAEAALSQYGYASMQQFRNWQWYKELGGGPLAELGSHQLDVFNWFTGMTPKSVMASGGTLFYDKESHQWSDTLMAIFEYASEKENLRAFYQTVNSNSNFGHIENFMGDQGTLYLSESAARVKVYREPAAPDWSKWVKLGILESEEKPKEEKKPEGAVLDVQETVIPPSFNLPVKSSDPVFKPHLENFFNAVRGKEKLNCPAETAYPATVLTLKINEAAQSGQKIEFKPEDFLV
ncbi:MAG: Gfo/Idh/MocA family oxidoreductase [Candidatus Omnitrophota bacterium]